MLSGVQKDLNKYDVGVIALCRFAKFHGESADCTPLSPGFFSDGEAFHPHRDECGDGCSWVWHPMTDGPTSGLQAKKHAVAHGAWCCKDTFRAARGEESDADCNSDCVLDATDA